MSKCLIKNNIRKFRFEANEMSQQELADKAKVTRQAILAIESSKYSPSLELAFRISKSLGKTIEEVFSFIEE